MPISTARRPRRAWRTTILAGVLALLAGCTGEPVDRRTAGAAAPTTEQPASSPPPRSTPSAKRPSAPTVTLAFAGDVMFEDQLRELLDEPESSLDPLRPVIGDADFTMVNFEAALTTRGTKDPKRLERPDNRYHFRSGPEALTALRGAGVDAVSVANNHGADYGTQGLAETLAARDGARLPVIGVGRDLADAFTPHRVTLKGQRFAFLAADASFLESEAPSWQAGSGTPGLAAARGAGRAALEGAVSTAAAAGDTVVVYLHWGEENSADVTDGQQSLARMLSRAGAAVVVGSHSHRLQGAGWLGSTYVAYGLGNFVWYHGISGAETGLLQLSVRGGRVVADGWRPAVIPREGGLPVFSEGAEARRATSAWEDLRPGSGLAARPSGPRPAPPPFTSSVGPITPALRNRMASTYRSDCPVPLRDLAHLRLSYWDFQGRVRQGELVVAAKHADDVVTVFAELYRARFPLQRMALVSAYGGDDEKSMAANNTSAFNCRTVAGTDRWSQHSFGAAIDLNPVQNPYVTGAGVSPRAGRAYADRADRRAEVRGLITDDSVVVEAFADIGWEWGGDWAGEADYQHFSAAGS
jgi:hypothetical protein